ncbi:pilus assembly protein PilS [Neisseria gonorrhoeae]
MPSEPSDGIFDAPAVYGRGAGAGKYPYRHCRQHRNLETRHSRQYRNLEIRHSRAGGNPDPRRGGNLSEITETPCPRFPLPWE